MVFFSKGWSLLATAPLGAVHASSVRHGGSLLQDAGQGRQGSDAFASHGRHLRHPLPRQVPVHGRLHKGGRREVRQGAEAGTTAATQIHFPR